MDVKLPPHVVIEVNRNVPFEQYEVVYKGDIIGTLTPERDTIEARGYGFTYLGEFETDQEALDAILDDCGISKDAPDNEQETLDDQARHEQSL